MPEEPNNRNETLTRQLPGMSGVSGSEKERTAEPRPERIGAYRILDTLGEGGMGVVYLAEQTQPVRRRVAMKVVKLGMDTKEVVARFASERQALAVMNHPNVAAVYDAGVTEQGRPYFVMEYVPGVPITAYCDKNKLGLRERLELFMQVCAAVQHAHQKGIIHRDIKPSNVLVMVQDGKAVPKVIDFGVAKATQQQLTERTLFTQQGQLIGTPEYMSPEQAEMSALDVDTRTDVYSLGVVLYELLVGALPFDPTTLRRAGFAEIQRIIREVEPPRPSTRLGSLGSVPPVSAVTAPPQPPTPVPSKPPADPRSVMQTIAERRRLEPKTLLRQLRGDLDWITMKAMDKDRTRRYASASEFAADIERYMNHEPVKAGPPTARYRLGKFLRKNRAPVAAALVVLTVLVAGLVGTSWGVTWALRERSGAIAARDEENRQREQAETARRAETEQRLLAERKQQEARWQAYVANITAADASLRLNEVFLARPKLDACPEEFRGWEWRYLNALSDSSLLTLHGHTGGIRAMALSSDGRRVITGSQDHTARIWEASSGREVAVLRGHIDGVSHVAFSPDGKRAVTGSGDHTAILWDAESGEALTTLRGHTRSISSVVFSPDGLRVLTGSFDDTARIWDSSSGQELAILRGHTSSVLSARFSSDGKRVLTASRDKMARIWDTEKAQSLATLHGHNEWVQVAVFSPDDKRVATASGDKTARIWDAKTGQVLITLEGHTGYLNVVAFNCDGTRVVTASYDNTARIWDAADGQTVTVLKGHTDDVVNALFFGKGAGEQVVTASSDGTAKTWRAGRETEAASLRGHTGELVEVAVSPQGDRIVTASSDTTAKLWGFGFSRGPGWLLDGLPYSFNKVASFSPDGARVIMTRGLNTAHIWDVTNPPPLAALSGHSGAVLDVAFSADGTRVASASDDHTAKVWNAFTGRECLTLHGHANPVTGVAFSPDGTRVVTVSLDTTAMIWDARTGHKLTELRSDAGGLLCLAISPDGKRIAAGSTNNTATLWDAITGQELLTLEGHTNRISRVAFSPDGGLLATASFDGTAKLWNAESGQHLFTVRGHTEALLCVAFSPDGKRLATASNDSTARIWDALTGQELLVLRKQASREPAYSVAFSPNGGELLVSWYGGGTNIYSSTPYAQRCSERTIVMAARSEAEKIVAALYDRLRDWEKVAAAVHADTLVSRLVRQQAVILILRSSRSANPLSQTTKPATNARESWVLEWLKRAAMRYLQAGKEEVSVR